MERLFNIVFARNDKVIPFYFEIRESSQWIADFAKEFLFTFISQYIAFKTRNPEYFNYSNDYSRLINAAKKEGLEYLT